MFRQLHIHNFQSHKHAEIEFSPGVNVIVGQSGSGKTAILRALRWAIYNEPSGTSFQSHFRTKDDQETYVCLEDEGGQWVTRARSNTLNVYQLDEEEFKAGTSVPAPIQDSLNINDLNFLDQMDKPFLLSDSPAEVGRILNKIVHLDQIDITSTNISREILSTKKLINLTAEKNIEIENQIKDFYDIDSAQKDLERCEEIISSIDTLHKNRMSIKSFISEVRRIRSEKASYKVPENIFSMIEVGLKKARTLVDLEQSRQNLSEIIKEMRLVQKQKKELFSIPGAIVMVDDAMEKTAEMKSSLNKTNELKKIMSSIRNLEERVDVLKKEKADLEKEFNAIFPDRCPLCNSEKPNENKKNKQR